MSLQTEWIDSTDPTCMHGLSSPPLCYPQPRRRRLVVDAPGRRHGDPFPLPSDFVGDSTLASVQSRRALGATRSLNHLAAASDNSRRGQGHDSIARSCRKPTAVQDWMLKSVRRRVCQYGEQPADLSEEDSLRELLEARDLYSIEPKNIATVRRCIEQYDRGRSGPRCLPMPVDTLTTAGT